MLNATLSLRLDHDEVQMLESGLRKCKSMLYTFYALAPFCDHYGAFTLNQMQN